MKQIFALALCPHPHSFPSWLEWSGQRKHRGLGAGILVRLPLKVKNTPLRCDLFLRVTSQRHLLRALSTLDSSTQPKQVRSKQVRTPREKFFWAVFEPVDQVWKVCFTSLDMFQHRLNPQSPGLSVSQQSSSLTPSTLRYRGRWDQRR